MSMVKKEDFHKNNHILEEELKKRFTNQQNIVDKQQRDIKVSHKNWFQVIALFIEPHPNTHTKEKKNCKCGEITID